MVFKPPRILSLGFIFLLGDILSRCVNAGANTKRKRGYLRYLLQYSKLQRYDLEKESIPKINSFFWTLADNNLLSSNNYETHQERNIGALGPLDALSINWWRILSPYLLGMQFFKISVFSVTPWRKSQSSEKTMERGLLYHFVTWREAYSRFCDMERGLFQVPKK